MGSAREKIFIALITLAAILNYTATEIYLPALPSLTNWFQTSTSHLQFTISIFLLGSAIAQLCTGPIIERYSYRKTALIASALFIFSSLFCAFSSSIFLFINARFLQALATGTLAIIARASLSKKFSAQKTMSIYLLISPILAFSLAFSPFIGGYLNTYLGWQSIFYFLALLGLLLFYLCFRYLFIPQNQNELININIKTVIHTYSQLLKNNLYVACAIGLSAALAQITAFLSESPFLFHQLGYNSSSIGKFYILYSIAFILGSYFTRKTISYFKFNTLVYIGLISEFIAIIILFILSFFPIQYAYEIFSPTFFSGIGNGILVALLTGKAISLFKRQSGYAAGFISALAFFASMLSTGLVNYVTHGYLRYLACYMFFIVTLGLIGFCYYAKENGK